MLTMSLVSNRTTWDEHVIELTLTKPAILGHIDFRFSLYQPCANPPAVQVTLLKQNTSGFGYRMKAPNNLTTAGVAAAAANNSDSSVDDNVDFKLGGGAGEIPDIKRECFFFVIEKF